MEWMLAICVCLTVMQQSQCMSNEQQELIALTQTVFRIYLEGQEDCSTCMILAPRPSDEYFDRDYVAHVNMTHAKPNMLQCHTCKLIFESFAHAWAHYSQCKKSPIICCMSCQHPLLKDEMLLHICTNYQSREDDLKYISLLEND